MRRAILPVLGPRLALALVLALTAGTASAQFRRDGSAKAASVSATLTASEEDVYQALKETLADWKLRVDSLEDGIVKTEWVNRPKGDEMFRGRIVAEFKPDGYQTLVSVKHEKQRQARDLVTSMTSQSAKWMDSDGDWQIARDVLTSVEKALGHEEAPLELGKRAPSRVIEIADCIVPPEAATRINELKSRRRDLVTEVKAMDKQILDAVYAGQMEQAQSEVERIKARKSAMEAQITQIDREILALVVAD